MVISGASTRRDGSERAKSDSVLRTTPRCVDSQRDCALAKLSEPVQSRDMDPVSFVNGGRGNIDDPRCPRQRGSDVDVGTSACGCL